MAGDPPGRPERPVGADGAGGEEDAEALPPFVPSWRGFYALVILNLVLLIALFYGIQAWFA